MSIVATIGIKLISGFFGGGLGTITKSIVARKKAELNAKVALAKSAAGREKTRLNAEIKRLELELLDMDKQRDFLEKLYDNRAVKWSLGAIVIATAVWYCSIIFRTQYGYATPIPSPLDNEVKEIAKGIIWILVGGGSRSR